VAVATAGPYADNRSSTPSLSFYRPDALPDAQPTASKHSRQVQYWLISLQHYPNVINLNFYLKKTDSTGLLVELLLQ